ncbi:MAG TPA: aminotransferase class IV [Thermoanaerobaculia bacterium]|nr:aminotransferase class IV [Thermoanaerobaculia bacterium]
MSGLSFDSPAVASGMGLFETMLVVDGTVIQLREHCSRMARSSVALGFPTLDESSFREAALHAVRGVKGECAVRVIRVAGGTGEWLLHASMFQVPCATMSRRERGFATTLDSSTTRSLPQHKMTSYAVCTLALRDAVAEGADEALFTMGDSAILEGTGSNVFALQAATLVTAPVSAGILPGIIRDWVLATAPLAGLAIEERPPTTSEIEAGSFFTGSLTKLAPVRALNGRKCVSPGEPFFDLVRRYEQLIADT